MIDRRIGKVKLRRGTDLQRKSMIFEEGEIIYTTDTKRAFVGDGTTSGGIPISNRNYVVNQYGIPTNGMYGDIIHVQPTKRTYIIGYDLDGVTLKLYLIADASITGDLNAKLQELKTKFADISACLAAIKPVQPPSTTDFIWVEHPLSQSALYGDTINFSASAVGPYNDIIYTWEKMDDSGNYELIIEAIGNTYTIYDVTEEDKTYYRCVATSVAGTIYSKLAYLSYGDENGDSNFLLQENGYYILTEKEEYIEIELGEIEPTFILITEDGIDILSEQGRYIEVIK
jgi:hypothetical protein